MGQWTQATIRDHPCDVFEPSTPHPERFSVLYLHGVHLSRLADYPAFVELFEHHGLTVVAPYTRRSWWTDRICDEFDAQFSAQQYLLEHVLPYMNERWQFKPPRIGLLGTSMGGQGALRLAYKFPETFPVVAAISPAIDYQLRMEDAENDEPLLQMYSDPEAARQDTAILHIHPLNWPRHQFFCCDPADHRWYDSADRLRMKLGSLGVPFDCELEATAGGHGFEYYCHMADRAIGFLVERLNSERLRVV